MADDEKPVVPFCVECEDVPALVHCKQCDDDFCGLCFRFQHHRGNRTKHNATLIKGADPKLHLVGDGTTDMFAQLNEIEEVTARVEVKDIVSLKSHLASEKDEKKNKKEKKSHEKDATKQKIKETEELMHIEKKPSTPSTDSDDEEDLFGSKLNVMKDKNIPGQFAKWIPLRLTPHERDMLAILEGVLSTSEYTDKVDVAGDDFGFRMSSETKVKTIRQELNEIFSLISGLTLANNFQTGRKIVQKSFKENESLFQDVFEVGRRYKIMNPDKMRTTYGKLMHLLQDAVRPGMLDFEVIKPIKTVYSLLESRHSLALLDDPLLEIATSNTSVSVQKDDNIKGAVKRFLSTKTTTRLVTSEQKKEAEKAIIAKYASENCTEDIILLALNSISDANAYLQQNRDPVQHMLDLLRKYFVRKSSRANRKNLLDLHEKEDMEDEIDDNDDNEEFDEEEYSTTYFDLTVKAGTNGACLSHNHDTQIHFVGQSLCLWREIQGSMFKLWMLTDADLLDSSSSYRLYNTGQGMARMQSAPRISREMHNILGKVQNELKMGWVGLSVVHLGDRDVPNALFFIDKYTQVPRILCPLLQVIHHIPRLAKDPYSKNLFEIIQKGTNKAKLMQRFILRDYFRYGFDGSGSDGGSCIDGRLTSSWNWCSKCHKKVFYPIMLATGFQGFDGDFR